MLGNVNGIELRASRGRLLLALYLDFVIFSVPWAFIHQYVFQRSDDLQKLSTPAKFVAFAVLELLLHRFLRMSPGEWLLSIRRVDVTHFAEATSTESRAATPFVNAQIKFRENWFTLLVAVLVLLEGTKGLVRWTMWTPPSPMFGSVVSDQAWPIVAMAAGAVECVIAYLLFRTRVAALVLAIPYFLLMIVSVMTSWSLWDSWVAENVTRRRAYQGLPVRDGEIAQMQAITPEIVVGGIAFYLVIVLLAGVMFARRARRGSVGAVLPNSA